MQVVAIVTIQMVLLILLSLLPLAASQSLPCDTEPLQIPIKDVQVVPSISDSIMRGIPASIGTPPQQIVLLPWAELNNTWVYDEQDFCDRTVIFSDTICQVRRGNLFQESKSTTWSETFDIIRAGGAVSETQDVNAEKGIPKLVSSSVGGTDIMDVGGSGNLSSFPIGIPRLSWDKGYTTLHALGLGRNSTFVNSLRTSGRIGSRVWSIFWGRMWSTQNPMDGSIVLGGYDRRKVLGNNHTQALDYSSSGCWTGMSVTLTDIKVNFRDGSDVSLFEPNAALRCCISPQKQLLLEAPNLFFETFQNVTKTQNIGVSFGLHWSAYLFDFTSAFDGDITFQLSSGLEIRIPNDQYIIPQVFIERNGSQIISKSKKELLINSVGAQPATLGRYFFTAAYLMVNQDAGSFTIWQANPSSNSDLVSVLDEKTAAGCENTTAVIQDPVPTTTSNPGSVTSFKAPREPTPSSSPSVAAVAGIVIGSVLALAALGTIAFILIRRRRSKQEAPGINMDVQNQSHYDPPKPIAGGFSELTGSKGYHHEMEGSEQHVYEMPTDRYSASNWNDRRT